MYRGVKTDSCLSISLLSPRLGSRGRGFKSRRPAHFDISLRSPVLNFLPQFRTLDVVAFDWSFAKRCLASLNSADPLPIESFS